MNFGLYGAYLSYKKPTGYTGDKYAIAGSGEIGAGIQLSKIGLYVMVNYIADLLYVNGTDETTTAPSAIFNSYEQKTEGSIIDLSKGIEIRFGYTFDAQALFH